jgi:hypothetical protein
MKKTKSVLITLLITLLLIVTATSASAVELIFNPNIIVPGKILPERFISRHEVIKAVPVYRVLVADKIHWYTTNADQFNFWASLPKINNDGIAAYISPAPLPYTVPMWNMVKNGVEQYFVTSEANRDYVIGNYGYQDCGIMGYVAVLEDTANGNAQMFQWYRGNSDNLTSELGDILGVDTGWDADHYYNWVTGYISSYEYQGPQFRIWSDAAVLQEIDVLSPNGGETLTGGTDAEIRWETLIPGGSVSLYYTLNPEEGWSVIAEGIDNTGSFSWSVPNSPTGTAIVEARWTYEGIDANCFDQSDKYFSIKAGSGAQINWGLVFKPVDLTDLLAPAAPTNLTAGANILQKKPSLYWKDNAANETAYVIERKAAGGSYAKLAQVAANQTKYNDSAVEAGVTYFYRVKAVNGSFSSGYSNEAAATVFAMPDLQLQKPPAEDEEQVKPPAGGQVSMLFTLDQNAYTINGVTKTMDASPVSIEGRTLLPIRFAAEPLGAATAWDGTEKKVTVALGETKLELWIGSNIALINGSATLIDPSNTEVKPLIMNSRTMLPMRFVTEKLGCAVEWLPASRQIKIDCPME